MADYLVEWAMDIEADSPEDAARKAYNNFMRPGSIAHYFTVKGDQGAVEVDLDRGLDTNQDGEPISYPLGEDH